MKKGKRRELTATISPANASDQQFSWDVKDTEIASVYGYTSETKTVTALKEGQTQITVTVDGQTASCTVTVTPRTISVESITLNKTQLSLVKGATETLTATVLPTTATDKAVTWESSDTAVATVENGVVTAVAAGNATITAKAGRKNSNLCGNCYQSFQFRFFLRRRMQQHPPDMLSQCPTRQKTVL